MSAKRVLRNTTALLALAIAVRARAGVIEVNDFGGSVEVAVDVQQQRISNPGSPDRKFDQLRTEERVSLDLGGSVFSPEILRYDLGTTIGFRQESIDASDSNLGKGRGLLLGYDGLLSFYPVSSLSLLLNGSRVEDSISRNLGTDSESLSQALGATLRWAYPAFPTTLSWRQLRTSSLSRTAAIPNRRDETRRILELSGAHGSEARTLRVRLRDEDVDDRSLPAIGDSHIREADLVLGLRWGPYFEKYWQTGARYFDRKGRFGLENASVTSTLGWDPTETLALRLDHDFTRFVSRAQRSTTHVGTLSIRHRLYDSLRTHLRLFGESTGRRDGKRVDYGGDLSLGYRKKLPWNSSGTLDLAIRQRVRDQDFSSDRVVVVDEALVVDGSGDNFLENRRVDLSSVQVLESRQGPPLILGADYELRSVGNRLSLDVLPGGRIRERDVLSIGYTYETAPREKVATSGLRFAAAWDLGWLRLRYSHSQSNDRLLAGDDRRGLQDSRRDALRIDLRRRGPRLEARASASLSRDATDSIDYDELAFEQSVAWRWTPTVQLGARLRERWRDFDRPERRARVLDGRSWLSWKLRRSRSLRLFADYRRHRDTLAPDEVSVEAGVTGAWRIWRVDILPSFSWLRRERGGNAVQDLRGALLLRRNF